MTSSVMNGGVRLDFVFKVGEDLYRLRWFEHEQEHWICKLAHEKLWIPLRKLSHAAEAWYAQNLAVDYADRLLYEHGTPYLDLTPWPAPDAPEHTVSTQDDGSPVFDFVFMAGDQPLRLRTALGHAHWLYRLRCGGDSKQWSRLREVRCMAEIHYMRCAAVPYIDREPFTYGMRYLDESPWPTADANRSMVLTLESGREYPVGFDLVEHIAAQQNWSYETFGPPSVRGTEGVIDHLRKELKEVAADPSDLEEWIDIITLAIDGAYRAGHTPEATARALGAKFEKNRNREWPDWRSAEPGKAIEHVRDGE